MMKKPFIRFLALALLFHVVAEQVVSAEQDGGDVGLSPQREGRNPIVLKRGPHLLLDEHLIDRSVGIKRKVVSPQRFLDMPIITGASELAAISDGAARTRFAPEAVSNVVQRGRG
jgi:hypothetical protein